MRIISGIAKGRKILPPEGDVTRPTLDRVKESIFNIIQNRVRGAVVADIFAGTGSLGLEAASRGAEKCYLIDRNDTTFSLLKKNVENLKFKGICKCCKGDSYEWLKKFADEKIVFDLIFIDPPYAKDMIPPAIDIVSDYKLLKNDGLIVCKIDSGEDIFEGNDIIKLSDKRKYGNTTVVFYKHRED
ncbi:ribosomal RNA small subunit methyltransferase D [Clostridium tepidiprofundi DSM 19306]|uniref:Ribosomal RNA small subunit methyltransferase D n=1 Tax=Clostridium tepidiprofundi DSM 19306 TaxID=1121338 RepID=A0A151B7W8_9CLOT|nr:16S rRNA (guanine(966)-N(2))-methyltransferase RsmD [Clostridium tepidiprofundi]KYH35903.1 ribosomal RNA small subunit methyltransferase D [Clostridium tepidiprofundi DSM 19306]